MCIHTDIFDLTCHIQDETSPEFAAALSETVNATQALVTKFVQLGPHNGPRVVASDAFPQCQKAQNEVSLKYNVPRVC